MTNLRKLIREILENNNPIHNYSFGLTEDDVDYFVYKMWGEYLDEEEEKEFKEAVRDFMSRNFGFDLNDGTLRGLENFPDTIELYRIISLEEGDIKNLDEADLGSHWTWDNELLYKPWFHSSIGLTYENEDELFIIGAKFKKEDVHPLATLLQSFAHGDEKEIVINKGAQPLKYKIYKY